MFEVKVPQAGESVTEADIAQWMKSDGDYVKQDEAICELETDKASMEVVADKAGKLSILIEEGETVEVGTVIAKIDEQASAPADDGGTAAADSEKSESTENKTAQASAASHSQQHYASQHPSPAAGKILKEKGLDPNDVQGSGKDGRITKADAEEAQSGKEGKKKILDLPPLTTQGIKEKELPTRGGSSRNVRREKMTRLRRTISNRLVEAQQSAALLTTFNEVDVSAVKAMRSKYKEMFKEKHEIGLGFMSFFTKAAALALMEYPIVNAQIDFEEVVYHDYADVGIAVATPKGLVVPVLRNAESLSFAEVERGISGLAKKGRDGKLSTQDMQGGTFTITNGGVFGSMLSTPIVNRPQSAILGMHNIVERPVAVNGQVEIRPIMYLALTYDHRIIDGSQSVKFLVRIKELIEDPSRLLIEV